MPKFLPGLSKPFGSNTFLIWRCNSINWATAPGANRRLEHPNAVLSAQCATETHHIHEQLPQ